MSQTQARRRRGGGRAGAAARRGTATLEQMPWKPPTNIDRPVEPLTEEGIAAIHDGAMRILEEIGVQFLNDEALEIFKEAGVKVDGELVRMDRDFVMEMVGKAPSEFTLTPRNPDRSIRIGGNSMVFGNVSSPPNYWDMDLNKKVPGTREHCQNLLKLTQYFNCIHFAGGYPVEPVDLHASIRHLDVLYDKLTLTDKVMHAYSLGKERVEDVMEMVRIAGGLSHAEFDATPHMYTNINSTSPLKHDEPMIDGSLRLVRRGQPVIVSPFTLAGAMAPVTMAGAVAQSLAEALCAIALFQYVRPGTPCAIGTFTSNVDMKSGAPAFGTPEYMRATQMTGQMARFYGLPLRSSGVCAANVPDGQAMWETSNSLWAAVQSGTNMVYHAAGWLEGGLIASPEKFIMDCEVLQMIQRYMDPAVNATGPEEIALDAIREVGNDGHFFGIQHTQDRYATAFYQPFLSDWHNYEAWEAAGGTWTAERANGLFKQIINEFEAPALDEGIREELQAFVARRKEEGGAPTDF
ncbi:trimethylamine methyltransferase family protein [Tritonibacter mobilis]|uniref:trimethylamine methyltransferase family protein n=1 Tax=Tritonibacter mobilis TaxID=379347 RepID=UPI0001B8A6C5|nr:trimethylamine methyltransferase family protein [Tritonibacter mobilis]EEW59926.1 trimethylamine methyltransferase [Ruegeria sp. TrichCH4B]MEE2810450.1 trimethylamine methyltransferase family protein [Pseudomonadota bacterium]PXW81049.1 trimethylamine--corrinoid protein Co-methyltransferase [Ruegeria sp. P4]